MLNFKPNSIDISPISERFTVVLSNGRTAQFTCAGPIPNPSDLEIQIKLGFTLASTFDDVEKHLQINGYNVEPTS